MTETQHSSRWHQGIGESARLSIFRAIQNREPIDALTPFGTVDGRADFRGFHDKALRGISGATLACCDFSFCNLSDIRISDCIFKDVVFHDDSLRGIADHGNRFDGCQFQGTSFRDAVFGVKRSQFAGYTFSECDFSGLRFGQVEFDSCRFENCQLKGVDFGASSFVEATFSGTLEDVWFRGRDPFLAFTQGPAAQLRTNEMRQVSFVNTALVDVTFSDNCPLSRVALPQDGSHRLLDNWPARIRSALNAIQEWDDQRAWNYVTAYLAHADNQSEYILNRNAIVQELGDDIGGRVFESLLNAEI